MDPGPISFTLLLPFTFTRTVYFYLHTITFYHSIRLILCLQQTGEIDNLIVSWGKVLGYVVCRFHVVASESHAPAFSGAIVWSVAKLASITFWSLAFSYWFDKPRFHNWGKLAVVLLIPSSWGSQLGAYNALSSNFSGAVEGRKKISARGVSHAQSLLCFCFALF
jgi:hypothetical protein